MTHKYSIDYTSLIKINMKILTASILGLGLLAASPLQASGTDARPRKPMTAKRSTAKQVAQEQTLSYFASQLAHRASTAPRSALAPSDISDARQAIWALWSIANRQNEREPLPRAQAIPEYSKELQPIRPHQWHLSDERIGEKVYPAVMPFYYGSKGDKPAAGYPLYVFLHGSGPVADEWETAFYWSAYFADRPSMYFIPQMPNAVGDLYRWWRRPKLEAWEKLMRLAMVSKEIDPSRLYFLGISEGGYGSQRLASYYADYLAAAGPMAGGEPLINAPVENLRHLGFSLRTGANDVDFNRNDLTMETKKQLDSMERLHPGDYKHWIELVPDKGHAIPYEPTSPYLSKFTRIAQPKTVSWEDFPIDGMYRQGFYNLVPLQRPAGSERALYEEVINADNSIDIKVQTVSYRDGRVSDRYTDFRLVLSYIKEHKEAKGGRLRVYLSPELIDMSKPVHIRVNGREAFSGSVRADWSHLATSCALFFDPLRLFPAAVEVSY